MSSALDHHGQPLNRYLNADRLNDRVIDELLGLCRGILADGIIAQEEAAFLSRWIQDNRGVADVWPARVIYARIREMLTDGILDSDEQAELLQLLHEITGGGISPAEGNASGSSMLPLCVPAPPVSFSDRRFCLTGKFAFWKPPPV